MATLNATAALSGVGGLTVVTRATERATAVLSGNASVFVDAVSAQHLASPPNYPIPPRADAAAPVFLVDPANGAAVGATGPYANALPVTPGDVGSLPATTRALWIGGAGNVTVDTLGGQTVTLTAVAAGTLLPLQVSRVRSATTATLIVALW
jgi:hypothetical protein